MTMFWVYAALLTVVALAFLITPLLRGRGRTVAGVSRTASNLTIFRDQLAELDADLAAGSIDREQWEAARGDLQRGLLEDAATPAVAPAAAAVKRSTVAAVALAVALPIVAVSGYVVVGNPQGLNPSKASAMAGAPHGVTQAQIEGMVAELAQRLKSKPDDAEGWIMLARSYSALGRFGEAANAYAQADSRFKLNAQLLADYADSLAMSQGQSLLGKPEALIQRALKADGNNLKALALAGTVEFEKQDFAKAAEYWRRILPLLPAGSESGDSIRASIKEAEQRLGGAPKLSKETGKAGELAAAKSTTATTGKERLSGTITLAPALAARAAPEDTVFVFARPAKGSRMPLAVERVKVTDLPLKFSFDDSMAMNPAAKLSDFSEVVVEARVSKSGNVMPQPGDFDGVSKPVHPGTKGVHVEIAKEIR
ncbi:MAG TPA: c-type cytochrome biogenesis protein CcmI [Burkholderiales bacterium]|nr:c-type cytochrome biogenesis protein CcmI [Burkholderiales bacterium]